MSESCGWKFAFRSKICRLVTKITGLTEAEANSDCQGDCHRLDEIRTLRSSLEKLEELVTTDVLTGTLTRRSIIEKIEMEIARCKRNKALQMFSVLIIDIDQFKRFNSFGWFAGDSVLREIAKSLKTTVRSVDQVGRLGGDEFLVLMPETSKEAARALAERIRQKVEQSSVSTDAGDLRTTISIGVTESAKGDESHRDLLVRADKALRAVKNSGKNGIQTN